MKARLATAFFLLSLSISSARAEFSDELKKKYSSGDYMVGIGEVKSSGDPIKDRKRAEILARLEIAKGIKIRVKESTVDVMCEGKGKALYDNASECRDQVVMVVESSVDEVLEGTKIIETVEHKEKGFFYAVALLPRENAALKAGEGMKSSMERARESIGKAKAAGDKDSRNEHVKKAKEEIVKGVTYAEEQEALQETKAKAGGMFDDLAGEIALMEKGGKP